MASSIQHHLFILLSLIATASAATSFQPKGLLLPLTKEASTLQYIVKTTQRTPSKSVLLTLSLGSPFLWQDCDRGYVSSTYRPARCNSAQCTLAESIACGTCNSPRRPGCNNNTCGLFPENPFTNTATGGELASDVVRINSTDGSNLGRVVTVPNFLFNCAPTFLLKGLAKGVQGIAGFGMSKISIPSQLTSTFNLPNKFALCLTSDVTSVGVIFFGNGPYRLYPGELYVPSSLQYTPILTNPNASSEYYIGVNSIKIGNSEVPINKALLSINNQGNGGTKISTIHPYTIMESSIYKAVTSYFDVQLKKFYQDRNYPNATRINAVAPFGLCYDGNTIRSTRVGLEVPNIELVLQNDKVVWTLFASNSMVRGLKANPNAVCLAIVDGGKNPATSIVLGGYQLEDNLLEFDVAKSRLGFRYLVNDMTRCSCCD
ncbi:probable aspartic proteinase GIP2 [Spinacia oleracea]|uniref:Probable aspartic proteinase GIP2 n=1 Tax=Spinacia oleracea TaxID=3562 RepID=A0A9R0K8D1_SPIOL|nr:probable aspartic proteinase GIP2 [Spinacia oleracea]